MKCSRRIAAYKFILILFQLNYTTFVLTEGEIDKKFESLDLSKVAFHLNNSQLDEINKVKLAFMCPSDGAFLSPAPDDCSRYYRCRSTEKGFFQYAFSCGDSGEYFSIKLNKCVDGICPPEINSSSFTTTKPTKPTTKATTEEPYRLKRLDPTTPKSIEKTTSPTIKTTPKPIEKSVDKRQDKAPNTATTSKPTNSTVTSQKPKPMPAPKTQEKKDAATTPRTPPKRLPPSTATTIPTTSTPELTKN